MGLFSVKDQSEVDNILNKIKTVESIGHNYPNRMGIFFICT